MEGLNMEAAIGLAPQPAARGEARMGRMGQQG
jgi:hypothetical protein